MKVTVMTKLESELAKAVYSINKYTLRGAASYWKLKHVIKEIPEEIHSYCHSIVPVITIMGEGILVIYPQGQISDEGIENARVIAHILAQHLGMKFELQELEEWRSTGWRRMDAKYKGIEIHLEYAKECKVVQKQKIIYVCEGEAEQVA